MVSSTAVTVGDRHHGSVRRVFWLICALVLAGASVTCVIRRRLRPGTHWDRSGSAGGFREPPGLMGERPGHSGLLRGETLFQAIPLASLGQDFRPCETRYIRPFPASGGHVTSPTAWRQGSPEGHPTAAIVVLNRANFPSLHAVVSLPPTRATTSSSETACRMWPRKPVVVTAMNSEFRMASSVASIAAWKSKSRSLAGTG